MKKGCTSGWKIGNLEIISQAINYTSDFLITDKAAKYMVKKDNNSEQT